MIRSAARCALLAALLSACTEKGATPKAAPASTPAAAARPAAQQAPAAGAAALPTAAESDLALTLGKALFADAKLEEAEAQLKVAAAGGRPEADALLLKVQAELEARRRLADARQKFEAKDWAGAEAALAAVGGETSLRRKADELAAKVTAAKQAEADETKARIERALDKEAVPDAGAAP